MPDPTPEYLFNLAYAAELPQVETRVALRNAAALLRELQANRPPSHPDTDDAREHCRLAERGIRRPFADHEADDTYFCRTIRELADALDASLAELEQTREHRDVEQSSRIKAQNDNEPLREQVRAYVAECKRLRGVVESQDAVDLAEVLACNERLVAQCARLRSLLRRVQWARVLQFSGGVTVPTCPVCLAAQNDGHRQGCELAAELGATP